MVCGLTATNRFHISSDARFDPEDRGFEFDRQRKRIVSSFAGTQMNHGMRYKIDWFVDGEWRVLPERFVGTI